MAPRRIANRLDGWCGATTACVFCAQLLRTTGGRPTDTVEVPLGRFNVQLLYRVFPSVEQGRSRPHIRHQRYSFDRN